jgi:LysR family transcriptional regulator, hydrogen peroxide-inducible genes activator
MELRELRSLVALGKLGSISQVAEHLHLSAPAIHKHLKSLESELGEPLYQQVGRHLQLTHAAEVVLPYFKDILALHAEALSAFEEWKGTRLGLLRVGTGVTSYILPILLKKFRHAHPGVELLVESEGSIPALLEKLSTGVLDLAMVVSADLIEATKIAVEASWDYELVLVSHKCRLPSRPHLADLKDLPFILFRRGTRFEQSISNYFAQHGFSPKVIMRFDSAQFIRSMVLSGLGVSVLPLWLVHKDVMEKRLTLIRQAEPTLFSNISLVRRKSTFVPQPMQSFIAIARRLERKDLPLLTSLEHASLNSGGVRYR